LSLLFAELAVRIARPQEAMSVDRGLYEPDPPRRYRLHPGYHGRITNHVEFDHEVAINSHGMRGPEPSAAGEARGESNAAATGVAGHAVALPLRVLALGDSFTFGVGAGETETFPARLETHLRAAGVPAEVWNAGAPGYGVPDEVAWYERWGVPLRPDVVVIAPFLANDLQDAEPGSPTHVVNGELVATGGEGKPVRRWLYYHSHLVRLIKSSLLEGPLRQKLGLPEPWALRERRAELGLYDPTLPLELEAGEAATDRAVAELARLTARNHARAIAVLVPSLPQVDPARWQALYGELGMDLRDQDPRRPNRLFAEIFARHGVPVIDPTDALAAAVARGERVYYARDQHLTPVGYDLLAREVARAVLATQRDAAGGH
jgi:lysophospholipase L1-like esterase